MKLADQSGMEKLNFSSRSGFLLLAVGLFTACSGGGGGGSSGTVTTPSTGDSLPVVTITSPADGSSSSSTSLTVSGACTTAAGTVTVSGTGLQSSATGTCTNGSFSISLVLTSVAGNKNLTVSQANSAGTGSRDYYFVLSSSCPENYVLIPADATLGTSAFCLAQYEMKLKTNAGTEVFDGYNGGVAVDVTQYEPDSRPNGVPWVRITQSQAITECSSLGTGFHLVTAKEWGAMARNVESVAGNWSSGVVGTDFMISGHSDGAISGSAVTDGHGATGTNLLSAGDGTDPYLGTGQAASDPWGSGREQKRSFALSNGEVIWDVAGNAREFNDVDGSGSTISYTGGVSSTYFDVFSATAVSFISSITISGGGSFNALWLQPANSGLNHLTHHAGMFYINSGARSGKILTRGANFSSSSKPGVFAADFDTDSITTGSSAGFRCAKDL